METLWLQVEAIGRDSRLPPITSITTWKPVGGGGGGGSEIDQRVEIIL